MNRWFAWNWLSVIIGNDSASCLSAFTQMPHSLYRFISFKEQHIRSKMGYSSASCGVKPLITCIIWQNYLAVQGNFIRRCMTSPNVNMVLCWDSGRKHPRRLWIASQDGQERHATACSCPLCKTPLTFQRGMCVKGCFHTTRCCLLIFHWTSAPWGIQDYD